MTMTRRTKQDGGRERQREDTRQRVYEAALEAFRRDGVEAARIAEIAQTAGVSHGTFHFHFATKEEVLAQRWKASEAALTEELESLPPGVSLTVVLAAVASVMGEEWENDPALFHAVGTVALRNLSMQMTVGRPRPVQAAIAARFTVAAERGELSRTLSPEVLADLFWVHVFAASLSWSAAPILPLAEVLEDAADLFLHGAEARPKR
jgi:AcrR family transcriptional regulator